MLDIENMTGFALILMRMSGCVLLNPILGRKNIPPIVRAGVVLMLSMIVYTYRPPSVSGAATSVQYALLLLKEFGVGYVIGYVVSLFSGVIMTGGEIIDMQLGLSMSKVYDPQSNVSMPLSGSIYNALFIFMFFAANGHLTLVNLFLASSQVVPYGQVAINMQLYSAMLQIFSQSVILALKLSMPLLAVELLLEIGVGILMKAIPQINVFVVNLQLKLLVGIIMTVVFFPTMASFIERLVTLLFEAAGHAMALMG